MVLFWECETVVFPSGVVGASDVRELDTILFFSAAIFAEGLVVCLLSGLSLDVAADMDFFFFPEELKIKYGLFCN